MKIAVYDTYVTTDANTTMHFDILVAENTTVEKVYAYGKTYLASKGVLDYKLTTEECRFCHMENAPEQMEKLVLRNGYYIIEMENC
ncbi:MAG: DUF2024 family protein [Cellulophaga sp.]